MTLLPMCLYFLYDLRGIVLRDNRSQFTLRICRELLIKFGYVAEYEGRSKNKEIEWLMRKHIKEFEKKYGTIPSELLNM